jgi:nucleotide sugar dehydrogenase
MNVTVIGAGKMGLPLACQLARNGAHVIACDVREETVALINQGRCPIDEPGIPELLAELVKEGRLNATSDTVGAVRQSHVVIIIVPVLLTPENNADASIIDTVSRQVAAGLQPGTIVSYETTLPVGHTREIARILEGTGLKAGVDFDVVFSPERVKSQFVLKQLAENMKVVGGITPEAAERAVAFYTHYLGAPVLNVGTLEAAELVKLAGMVYRDVNIALANEIARYAETVGVDLHSIIKAINSDGEAAMLLPGIGVGGHCAPIYPYFFIRDSEHRGLPAEMTRLGRAINDGQAAWAIDQIERMWQPVSGHRVLILGLGFRPQVKEHICSTAFLLGPEAKRRGAEVLLHDPLYTDSEIRGHGFTPFDLQSPRLPEVIILNTGHRAYASFDFPDLVRRGVKVVMDGRAMWNPKAVRSAGLIYLGIGRSTQMPDQVAKTL